jgi:hypothetical protein
MLAVLMLLGFMGLIFWFLAGRPRAAGRFGGQRVYLRRGPGLGGIALAVIAVVYLSSHVGQVEMVLLLIGLTVGVGALAFGFARRALSRNR